MKFKIGDKIRITGNSTSHCFKIGHKGVIAHESKNEYGQWVIDNENSTGNVEESDMKLITSSHCKSMKNLLDRILDKDTSLLKEYVLTDEGALDLESPLVQEALLKLLRPDLLILCRQQKKEDKECKTCKSDC